MTTTLSSQKGIHIGVTSAECVSVSYTADRIASATADRPREADYANPAYGSESANITKAKISTLSPAHTPWYNCVITHSKGQFKFDMLPDTGATISLVAMDIVTTHSMCLTPQRNQIKLLAVDDAELNNSGTVTFEIDDIRVEALVSDSISNEILIGWKNMKRLKMLPHKFPRPILRVGTGSTEEKKKLEE